MTHLVFILTLSFPIVIMAAILAVSARTRRGILFGVTLPLNIADSPQAQAALTRYRRSILATALVLLVITAALATHGNMKTASTFHIVAVFALLALALALRAKEAHNFRSLAIAAPSVRVADLAVPSTANVLALTAAPLLLLAATALWLKTHWQQIPARWPQHWNASGQVNGWGTRTVISVFFPLFMGAGIALTLLLINAFNTKAPGPQAVQRAYFAAPVAIMSWILTLIFCTLSLMPLYYFGLAAVLSMAILSMVGLLGSLCWSFARSGFFNTNSTAWTEQPYDNTPDHNWKAGIFYINRADSAIIVPKRFGFGWTLNFGHPAAWIFMGSIFLLALGLTLTPLLLHHH
jgi:uncharacterized membrane protein